MATLPFLRKFGEREKREKRYKKVAQGPASESEQAVLTNEEDEEVTSAQVCHTTRTTYDGGGKRRERNNRSSNPCLSKGWWGTCSPLSSSSPICSIRLVLRPVCARCKNARTVLSAVPPPRATMCW